jgi:methionyl-tRNA formyltransferase
MDIDASPGTVIKGFPDELWISTGKGVLSVMEIQGESGKRLLIKDFLRGYQLPPGTHLH